MIPELVDQVFRRIGSEALGIHLTFLYFDFVQVVLKRQLTPISYRVVYAINGYKPNHL
jgi:hypothetical protein